MVTLHDTLRDALFERKLLLPTAVPGIYGRSAEFEDTIERIDRLVSVAAAVDAPEVMRFAPAIDRRHVERAGYLESFPHLAGSVHSFAGDERAHRDLVGAARQGRDWSAALSPTGVMLTPAACYHVYPLLAGTLPPRGRLVDVMSYCFRREPSDDVSRMQMFRMHEHVCASAPADAVAWREDWIDRAGRIVSRLAIEARVVVAADPFFGRPGALLAASQRDQRLKLEIVAPIACADRPTAIVSLNYHQDHFGRLFDIRTADGAIAHTACTGFGLERIGLALYSQHGFERSRWPAPVREALGC
ncbi:MAG TPA: amino acid--[acyl-carrier-protein] ligase [Vicinamibacterales bacterium]|nr:amino acid--[acyl-carrier-protein] ligase [Vicinamibacterales bacterium]